MNLEDPIVCRFINANTDEKLFDFLKNFGLLRPAAFQSLQDIVDERYLLRGLLKAAGGDDFRRNIVSASFWIPMKPIVENTAAGNRQLVLIVDKLPSFMRMEIAAVAANGARFAQCQYCGDVFITGKGTAGRSTAKYCRPRCRVYANRDKLKSKGGRHVGAKA